MMEEQLDYGDEGYGGSQKLQYQGSGGAIPALAEEEMMGEDDEFDDLYNDGNMGEDFMQTMQQRREPPVPFSNGGFLKQKMDGPGSATPQLGGQASIPGLGVEGKEPKPGFGSLETEPKSGGFLAGKGLEEGSGDFPEGFSHEGIKAPDTVQETNVGSAGFHGNYLHHQKLVLMPKMVERQDRATWATGLLERPAKTKVFNRRWCGSGEDPPTLKSMIGISRWEAEYLPMSNGECLGKRSVYMAYLGPRGSIYGVGIAVT